MLTEKLANDIAASARTKTAGIFGTAARDLGEEIAPGATARILKGLGLGLGAGAGAYGIGTALGEGNGLYNDMLNAENANAAAAEMDARVQEAYRQQVADNIAQNRAIGPGMAAAMHSAHNPVHTINGPATMPVTMGASLAGPDYASYQDAMQREAARQALHSAWRRRQMAAAGGIGAGNTAPDYAQVATDMNNSLKNSMYDTYNAAIDNAKVNIPAALEATGQARRDLENYVQSGRASADIKNGIGNAFNTGVSGVLNGADKVMDFINKPRPQTVPVSFARPPLDIQR